MPTRKIIHVDMDAFYTSVEQRDFPIFRGKAIAVGRKERGVVAAASYEARRFGVHSAMPSSTALRLCPHLIFVSARFDVYRTVSASINAIFHEFTDLVEPMSLDEAYLDVTTNKKNIESANTIAKQIRQRIWEDVRLTASAGISINKFLAKVASDINKPNGQKTIHPTQITQFLEELPIQKFHGIGKVTAKKMKALGIFTGKDLKAMDRSQLVMNFGKSGIHYYNVVRGIHESPVNPNRIRKSVGVEKTFLENLIDEKEITDKLQLLTTELINRLNAKDKQGRTITLKIKYSDFTLHTRSHTSQNLITSKNEISTLAHQLWDDRPKSEPVRLLGLSISNLNQEDDFSKNNQLLIPFPWEE